MGMVLILFQFFVDLTLHFVSNELVTDTCMFQNALNIPLIKFEVLTFVK